MDIRVVDTQSKSLPQGLSDALQVWAAGVTAVRGEQATRTALAQDGDPEYQFVLALGKAASSMMLGAMDSLAPDGRGLVITKHDHLDTAVSDDPRIRSIESNHPVPDQSSLDAGAAAIEFIEGLPLDSRLLVLVSGGASALIESLVAGFSLDDLRELTSALLAEGYSIDQMNAIRIGISRVKGGKLLRRFPGERVQVYALSDIPGDDIDLIGSGIGSVKPPAVSPPILSKRVEDILSKTVIEPAETGPPDFHFGARLIATNAMSRDAAAAEARRSGLAVVESVELLEGDVVELASSLTERLFVGEPGVYLWGGEPTVRLPDCPGRGGRNQSLAVALAQAIAEKQLPELCAIVGGTDGTDGPTNAAGGVVYPGVSLEGASKAVAAADAEPWLRAAGCLLETGPTGTNVMDLAVVVKGPQ